MPEDKCSLCNEGKLEVGAKSDYGAAVVLKTGNDTLEDWYATLQPTTMTDPNRGIHCLLMPLGHVGSFADLNADYDLDGRRFAEKYGVATAVLSDAMQRVLEEEWKRSESGVFVPQQIIYGKHAEGRNTKPGHIHLRFTDFSGGLAQAYPSDNEWVKRSKESTYTDPSGERYVRARPVEKQEFNPERFEKLKNRLVDICSQI